MASGEVFKNVITTIKLQNLGTINKNRVVVFTGEPMGEFNLYFSYETLVGIDYIANDKALKKCVVENYWSTTTGKLLNELEPNKKNRVKQARFDIEVSKMFQLINA